MDTGDTWTVYCRLISDAPHTGLPVGGPYRDFATAQMKQAGLEMDEQMRIRYLPRVTRAEVQRVYYTVQS